jgi:hypothetical protein
VDWYPFSNGVVGGSNPTMKSTLLDWGGGLKRKKGREAGRKPRARPLQGRQQTPSCTKRILEQGRANGLKFTSDCPRLDIYLFLGRLGGCWLYIALIIAIVSVTIRSSAVQECFTWDFIFN